MLPPQYLIDPQPTYTTMSITISHMTEQVYKKIPWSTVTALVCFVTVQEPPLWAMKRGAKFYCQFVLVTLYKDKYAVGYNELFQCIKKWIGCSSRSLCHNVHILCHVHKKWGKLQVPLGTLSRWKCTACNLNLQGAVAGGCLWMDSFNVRLAGKHRASCKEPSWSYKANLPAQRFMALSDAHGCFHMLWGGYSPKVYDGEFLKMQRQFIEEELAGATVLADNHFKWGKANFHSIKFMTTVAQRRGRRETGESLATLTQEEETHKQPWHEDEEQQTALVWLAAGIINHRLQ
jgi:hypothetical protein